MNLATNLCIFLVDLEDVFSTCNKYLLFQIKLFLSKWHSFETSILGNRNLASTGSISEVSPFESAFEGAQNVLHGTDMEGPKVWNNGTNRN